MAMLKSGQTFTEALQDERLSVMRRHRLKTIRQDVYQQLDEVLVSEA